MLAHLPGGFLISNSYIKVFSVEIKSAIDILDTNGDWKLLYQEKELKQPVFSCTQVLTEDATLPYTYTFATKVVLTKILCKKGNEDIQFFGFLASLVTGRSNNPDAVLAFQKTDTTTGTDTTMKLSPALEAMGSCVIGGEVTEVQSESVEPKLRECLNKQSKVRLVVRHIPAETSWRGDMYSSKALVKEPKVEAHDLSFVF